MLLPVFLAIMMVPKSFSCINYTFRERLQFSKKYHLKRNKKARKALKPSHLPRTAFRNRSSCLDLDSTITHSSYLTFYYVPGFTTVLAPSSIFDLTVRCTMFKTLQVVSKSTDTRFFRESFI